MQPWPSWARSMQASMSAAVRLGEVGCRRTTQSAGKICRAWRITSSQVASSVANSAGRTMLSHAMEAMEIHSISSDENIRRSIYLDFKPASIVHENNMRPLKTRPFFLGTRLLPPRAGITASTVCPLMAIPHLRRRGLARLKSFLRPADGLLNRPYCLDHDPEVLGFD